MTTDRPLVIIAILYLALSSCGSGSNQTTSPAPAPGNPQTVTEAPDFQQQLDNIVSHSATQAAIARLSQGDQVWLAASGLADVDSQTAITTDAQMRIASMTKPMVAVTMLKLAEEGLLTLDDTISQYLPQSLQASLSNADSVTVRHLLSMTSGIRDYTDDDDFNDAVEDTPQAQWSAEALVQFIVDKPASFLPGDDWEYSNTNYVLCDIIVENITGNTLASQMRRILFTPLGMDSTYMEMQESGSVTGAALTVRGYDGDADVTNINDGIGYGDGGVVSTVSDISLFLKGVFADKIILSGDSLAQMQQFHPTEDYGLGLETRSYAPGTAVAHSGGSSGFSGDMMYFPAEDITWVVLTNQVDDDGFDAFETLSAVLSD